MHARPRGNAGTEKLGAAPCVVLFTAHRGVQVFGCTVQTSTGNSTGVIGLVMGRDIGTVVSRVGVRTSVRRCWRDCRCEQMFGERLFGGAMARLTAVVTNKCSAYFARILPVFCPCRKRGWQGKARQGERGERGKARRGGEAGREGEAREGEARQGEDKRAGLAREGKARRERRGKARRERQGKARRGEARARRGEGKRAGRGGTARGEEIASPTGNTRDTPYPYLSTALPPTRV